MNVKVNIYYPELERLIGGKGPVSVNGNTVGEALGDLVRQYPSAEKLIFAEKGKLLKQVYVWVNSENMYKADLDRCLTDRDQLILAVLITGG